MLKVICLKTSLVVLDAVIEDRKSTRLNSSHRCISYAVFCLKKKKRTRHHATARQPEHARTGDPGIVLALPLPQEILSLSLGRLRRKYTGAALAITLSEINTD